MGLGTSVLHPLKKHSGELNPKYEDIPDMCGILSVGTASITGVKI